jgi:hypothetical protein
MDVDDEAVGIGEEECGVLLEIVDVEDDARKARRDLRGADAGEEAVRDGEAFAGELGCEVCVVEIKINSVRVLDASCFELNLIAEVDGDASVGGGGPVTDASDESGRGRGGDGLEMSGLSRKRGAEQRREKCGGGAAEEDFPVRLHAADSLGLWALWGESIHTAGIESCTCAGG